MALPVEGHSLTNRNVLFVFWIVALPVLLVSTAGRLSVVIWVPVE